MTRSLSTPTSSASLVLVTQPGYLVEIGFETPLRLSSRGDVAVLGNDWTAWDVRVAGMAHDGARPATSGSLTLGDHDQSITALVLGICSFIFAWTLIVVPIISHLETPKPLPGSITEAVLAKTGA